MFERILVTGSTGYIGGRLIPRLLQQGYRIRALARHPDHLQGRIWADKVEIFAGDLLHAETLPPALEGMEAAYYLVHTMQKGRNFSKFDREAAQNFAQTARAAGLKRIIYLGGLGNPGQELSEHLRSRHEVGRILAQSGVPVLEFRAAVIVGSGSASFEMMRYPVEGFPILFCPTWVRTRIQPISVHDVLDYLIAALRLTDSQVDSHRILEIGGAEILTYHDMMKGYAAVRGLRRRMIIVPFLTLPICATFLHWVTPIPYGLAYALIEGMKNEVIVQDDSALRLFPDIKPRDYKTSLERALARLYADQVETTWSDAQISVSSEVVPLTLTTREGLLIERRECLTTASPTTVYRLFTGLGGKRGWLYGDWIWRTRGVIDRLVGGVGFRRGRRHPDDLRVGDALDFWRVETLIPDRLMRLRAEMKVPGLAWLQFEVMPRPDGKSLVIQTAFFEPRGFWGLFYWYVLYPIHGWMFGKLIKRIVARAEEMENSGIIRPASRGEVA